MATWQYDMLLIPRQKVAELRPGESSGVGNDLSSVDWWEDQVPAEGYQTILNSFLPRYKSWSEDIKGWGDEDRDRVDVIHDSGQVVEVLVRVDARTLDTSFLEGIIRLAQYCNCVFLTEEAEIIEPDMETLSSKISKSKAFEFVNDPEGFLERIKRTKSFN